MKPSIKILWAISIILLILFIYFVYLKQPEPIPEEPKPKRTLSEMQITACNAADKAGTCNTRLIEVGIVTPQECCEVLGKCC